MLRDKWVETVSSSLYYSHPSVIMLNIFFVPSNRVGVGSSAIPDEVEEAEEQPLVRNRSRLTSSRSVDSAEDIEEVDLNLPSSLQEPPSINHTGNRSDFPSDEVLS